MKPLLPLAAGWSLFAFAFAAVAHAEDVPDLAALNAQAQVAHGKRNLGDATELYQRIFKSEPAGAPTAGQRALVMQFVPRLHNVPGEFFPLKDIVAIVHPDRPVIGYHLFWEDDIGFPSDNEPCDHEIVWVEFEPATRKVVKVSTYFHGRVLTPPAAADDANAHGGRPWIAVEWGFHGSMPFRALETDAAVADKLKSHWEMARNGRQLPRDPLARGWPEEYAGDFASYLTFSVANDPATMLRERDLIYVSRWTNGTINRYCLRYNFAAKLEWPWLAK
jgi:hypothetical protein